MMTDDQIGFLVQEVSDLLDAGSVGLYEFLAILRGKFPDVPEDTLRAWADTALQQLIAEGDVRLVRLVWPSDEPIDEERGRGLSPADWADPGETPYAAITRD